MGHMADDGAVRDANWEGAIGGRTSFARKGLGSSESADRVARRCGGRSVIDRMSIRSLLFCSSDNFRVMRSVQ